LSFVVMTPWPLFPFFRALSPTAENPRSYPIRLGSTGGGFFLVSFFCRNRFQAVALDSLSRPTFAGPFLNLGWASGFSHAGSDEGLGVSTCSFFLSLSPVFFPSREELHPPKASPLGIALYQRRSCFFHTIYTQQLFNTEPTFSPPPLIPPSKEMRGLFYPSCFRLVYPHLFSLLLAPSLPAVPTVISSDHQPAGRDTESIKKTQGNLRPWSTPPS